MISVRQNELALDQRVALEEWLIREALHLRAWLVTAGRKDIKNQEATFLVPRFCVCVHNELAI